METPTPCATRGYDLPAARAALPALAELTYLNSGTEGIMAEPVARAYLETLGRFERYGHWARVELTDEIAGARERVARLIGANPAEVAIARSGTDGCAIVLGCLEIGPGDEIAIGSEEHPAIVYPAYLLQAARGARVRRFRFAHDPGETLASFEAELGPRTRIAAFSHVSCESGIRVPAREMIAAAHRRGIPVLLDGAQTIGSIPVDFAALGADFLTGSAHKWLCGPKGSGLLAVRRDRLAELVPRYVGGGSLRGDIRLELARGLAPSVELEPTAARFEFGMLNPATYAGLSRAIDYFNELGPDAVEAHERTLVAALKERIAATRGLRLQTPLAWEASSANVNVAVEGVAGAEVSRRLWQEWHVVQRATPTPDGVRICCNYFNDRGDLDRLIEALEAIRG